MTSAVCPGCRRTGCSVRLSVHCCRLAPVLRHGTDAFSTPTRDVTLYPKLGLAVLGSRSSGSRRGVDPAQPHAPVRCLPFHEIRVTRPTLGSRYRRSMGLYRTSRLSTADGEFHGRVDAAAKARHGGSDPAVPKSSRISLSALPLASLPAGPSRFPGKRVSALQQAVAPGARHRRPRPPAPGPRGKQLGLDRGSPVVGIEFFDHGGLGGRPHYLIDHTPRGRG